MFSLLHPGKAILLLMTALGCTFSHVQEPKTNKAPSPTPAQAVVPPPAKSNMSGTDTRSLDSQKDNPRILSLNADGQWVLARQPLFSASGTGPGVSFATEIPKADPDIPIHLVPCAAGGSGLSRWP